MNAREWTRIHDYTLKSNIYTVMRNSKIQLIFMGLAAFVALLTLILHSHISSGTHLALKEFFSMDWAVYDAHPKAIVGKGIQILRETKKESKEPLILPILEGQEIHKRSHDHNQEVRFLLRESNLGAPAFVGRNILDMGGGVDVYGKQGRGDSVLDHFGNLSQLAWKPVSASVNSIAIGLALTTRKQGLMTADNLQSELPFFKGLLSSFCFTGSAGYDYHFYVSHDHNDPFFETELSHQVFRMAFYSVVVKSCPKVFNVSLHLVECNHTGRPAWAQNDAMMAAYMDNMEYYYRLNDDTILETSGWTEKFIEELDRFQPPRVGVVGPWFKEGNYNILTHDFVHRTHIDIFGYYYPRVFTDWFADNWITGVYLPMRCRKTPGTRVKHTMEQGSRYVVHFDKAERVGVEVEIGKGIIQRWVENMIKSKSPSSVLENRSSNVISMSLYGNNIDKLYGAMRYAQLAAVLYPNWRMRFYTRNFTIHDMNVPKVLRIVVRKLELSGSEIIRLDDDFTSTVPPSLWHYLISDDLNVDTFIVRDTDMRPSEREAVILDDWLKSKSAWYCMRDHPRHAPVALVPALVGGSPMLLKPLFSQSWKTMMFGYNSDVQFLNEVIWPVVKKDSLCHDSVSCAAWPYSIPFPVLRKENDFVGQIYDANDELLNSTNTMSWDMKYTSPDCVFLKNTGFSEAAIKAVMRHRPVFWSQDYHVTPIMDIRSLLSPVGVRVIDKSLSSYCKSVGTCAKDLRVITRENGMRLTPDIIREFFAAYHNNSDIKQVTTFVCTLPISMCEAFLPFNKSLLIIATLRYEQTKQSAQQWLQFNELLIKISQGVTNVIAANNLYDVKYLEYFTGLKPVLLPNYCAYLSNSYDAKRREFLVTPIHSTELYDQFFADFDNAVLKHDTGDLTIFPLREMYPQYQFSDLAAHPGIIYVPYQVSMVSLTEHYRMNIPLFFPSLSLLTRWHMKYQVVRLRTWDGYNMKRANGSVIRGVMPGVPDPNNDYDEESVKYWLQFADFYRWPHIVYFDSVDDLVKKLHTVNLTEISENMKEHNVKAHDYIKRTWSRILLKLTEGEHYIL
ncbi:hypothetical protein LSH36_766g03157 [Paralvinella palmiformis]|uniref:Uncharacterized protein n=1 Tax=Paralvinella palmiformis TaxID=53620 RepID=A0AAD9J134_9ANNE|nr:hypothetical protein LSH36_766g03157 [Paralvinella palmiformis]